MLTERRTVGGGGGADIACSDKTGTVCMYEGWNFNSGNYLFTTDTK